MMKKTTYSAARQLFREHNGVLRTAQAVALGIPSATLYAMRETGIIVQESRGLYRLDEVELDQYPDLVQICQRVPKAVVCLISALDFHELTTQIPPRVTIALPRGARKPKIDYPPVQTVHMAPDAFEVGIDVHEINGLPVRVYSPEKTIADCIKFRRMVGIDVVQEALTRYIGSTPLRVDDLLRYARIDRVEKQLRRYLEVLV
jgi:predicted transcriptional regulator of viral defense system